MKARVKTIGVTAIVLLLTFSCDVWAIADETVRWTEDALLHDGRTVLVEREINETTEFRIADPFFGLPIAPRRERGGDVHLLKFRHPETGVVVRWQGEEYQVPMLLDVVDGVAYLVIYARPSKKHEQHVGCPDLPYVFLRSDRNRRDIWSPITADKAPAILRLANLAGSFNYQAERGRELRSGEIHHQGANFVQDQLRAQEDRSRHLLQREIPRTYEEWKYPDEEKNEYRNSRYGDDCRPPPKPLSDVALPSPTDVELETLETNDGTNKTADEYYKMLGAKKGTATRENCKALFTRADSANSLAGERFVNDPDHTKRPPYSGPAPIGSGARTSRYCDAKFIWYIAEREERSKIWITKYTAAGDLLYNARFAAPQTADNKLARNLVIDSTTGDGDYFYFYWFQSLPSPNLGPYAHRITKFRFREPSLGATTK